MAKGSLYSYFKKVREVNPLVLNLINCVTVSKVCDGVLACGANPIVSNSFEDVCEIINSCRGLNLNIGTVDGASLKLMVYARKLANLKNIPILLDPAGVGVSGFRLKAVEELISGGKITAICGNISEILAINFKKRAGVGVNANLDELVSEENLEDRVRFVKCFAKKFNLIVAVSGKIDLVSDGDICYIIKNGNPIMAKTVGTGCILSGIGLAFLAANSREYYLKALASAVCLVGLSGELGFKDVEKVGGASTHCLKMLDWILKMDEETFKKGEKFEIL